MANVEGYSGVGGASSTVRSIPPNNMIAFWGRASDVDVMFGLEMEGRCAFNPIFGLVAALEKAKAGGSFGVSFLEQERDY